MPGPDGASGVLSQAVFAGLGVLTSAAVSASRTLANLTAISGNASGLMEPRKSRMAALAHALMVSARSDPEYSQVSSLTTSVVISLVDVSLELDAYRVVEMRCSSAERSTTSCPTGADTRSAPDVVIPVVRRRSIAGPAYRCPLPTAEEAT